ncbi:unnamed protein product, partial [Polarella glacialis]
GSSAKSKTLTEPPPSPPPPASLGPSAKTVLVAERPTARQTLEAMYPKGRELDTAVEQPSSRRPPPPPASVPPLPSAKTFMLDAPWLEASEASEGSPGTSSSSRHLEPPPPRISCALPPPPPAVREPPTTTVLIEPGTRSAAHVVFDTTPEVLIEPGTRSAAQVVFDSTPEVERDDRSPETALSHLQAAPRLVLDDGTRHRYAAVDDKIESLLAALGAATNSAPAARLRGPPLIARPKSVERSAATSSEPQRMALQQRMGDILEQRARGQAGDRPQRGVDINLKIGALERKIEGLLSSAPTER